MTDHRLGAIYLGDQRCRFIVWAPRARTVEVHIRTPEDRYVALTPQSRGYFEGVLEHIPPGATYTYRLDGGDEWPDPASRSQPTGVHGPSAVVDPGAFDWSDATWRNVAQEHLVIYELHVGAFSPEGTFAGLVPSLPYLRDLGITAIELLPVAQFPGERNWGYDGVYPYAPHNSYGGPEGLRALVDACHAHGLAIILDCVYNHLGPEGNYLGKYGNYFTDRYQTPWGQAINMDGPGSDEVRHFFIENACYWVREFHIDGFRLDATDQIIDESATHFLQALSATVHRTGEEIGKPVWVSAESDANDVRYILPPIVNGYGLDAQWGDDFHHALHALLTGERGGYYSQFGDLEQMAKAFRQDFVYDGIYSEFRHRTHGSSPMQAQARQFVVAAQNHDQVGNRATGERLSQLVDFESAKLAAAVYLFSPYLPLIFMGEEYSEDAPFLYFTSHTDPALAEAVTQGRVNEFKHFGWQEDVPDPQDLETFQRSKLNHGLRDAGQHRAMLDLYRDLLRLRREQPALSHLSKDHQDVEALTTPQTVFVRRWHGDAEVALAFCFSDDDEQVTLPLPAGQWATRLATADGRYGGPGRVLPDELTSSGLVSVTLKGRSAVLFEHVADN